MVTWKNLFKFRGEINIMAAIVILPSKSRLSQDQLETLRKNFNPIKYICHKSLDSDDMEVFKNVVFVDDDHKEIFKKFPFSNHIKLFLLSQQQGKNELPGGQIQKITKWAITKHRI